MCGIIGYVGYENAIPKAVKGLSVLEYRGYDSVGLAAYCDGEIKIAKCKGRISTLEELVYRNNIDTSCCSIGHTRWATHGGPSDINAHPHQVGNTVIVHNGIIENYKDLKERFNVNSVSETDTEIAAAIIDIFYKETKDPVKAIVSAMREFKGSYAFGIMFTDLPEKIYSVRLGSPLIIAKSNDGYFISSDLTAILPFTKCYYCVNEGEIAVLEKDKVEILVDNKKVEPFWQITSITPESARKDGYPHFMLKEIYEQPIAIVKSLSTRIKDDLPDFSVDGIPSDFWRKIKNIQIVACGSAVHAGIVGGKLIEKFASIPTNVYIASEYRYNPPIAPEGTAVIVISQSGETADTLAALRYAKSKGLMTIAIVNAVETSIAREADKCIYTYAGPEIAVATTKGYCTQVSELYMLAITMGFSRGLLTSEETSKLIKSLLKDGPEGIKNILARREEIEKIAKEIHNHDHVFYIGRAMDYAIAMEAALKLKEISYIHCEEYAAGELKHGTISLVEEGTPVIALCTSELLFDKTESNIREVKSRGAFTVCICSEHLNTNDGLADIVFDLPSQTFTEAIFSEIAAIQLLAYETAKLRGCDIDRPRNLAKSVTVE